MRKNYQMWLLGALVGGLVLPFAGCSNEDDPISNESGSGETVKTQFAINIPYAKKAETKMSGDNTQNSGNFLGMYDVKLVPLTNDPSTSTASPYSIILDLPNIATSEITNGTDNTHIYQDINIAVGTKQFLFYAAGGTSAPNTDQLRFDQGIVDPALGGNKVEDISFSLRPAKIEDTDNKDQDLLSVLNAVKNVTGWANKTGDKSTLGDLYDAFITLKAGSANSIKLALEDLYNAVDPIAQGTVEDDKIIALAIQNAIETNDVFSVTGASQPYTLSTNNDYPRNINMPDGAAILTFTDGSFSYKSDDENPTLGSMGIKMADICFPASIYYFVNTPLKANTTIPASWPQTLVDWNSGFVDWGDEVLATTRAIALKENVQYGVSRLDLKVGCNVEYLEDHNGNQVAVPAAGFSITGVLVGGQPTQVGWNMEPTTSAGENYVVYDRSMSSSSLKTDGTTSNYTLVLDNKSSSDQKTVTIVVELTNDAADFQGVDGLIKQGATFYLIASLDPSKKTVDGVTDPWVFMQDYTTTAKLTITALKNAYNTIPDLRGSTLALGLSVDLDWKSGISFDVDIK